ncbi:MAG: alpha/beta hydrolase [Clostridiaceae bacterium]|nr:alpha/beta hydrolase [Clostridiaceae bacterium]
MYIEDKKLSFKSYTGQGIIRPLLYLPQDSVTGDEKQPKAIVLVIHGMAEHQMRYREFAEYLNCYSFAVCTFDLPGHGRTAPDENYLGFFSESDGTELINQDIDTLMGLLIKRFPDVPPVIFGHSMGSMIARLYCARTDRKLAGAIYSGTPAPNGLAGFASFLAARSVKKNGPLYRDSRLDKLMNGNFQSRIAEALTPFDWISGDKEQVDKYIKDPWCGYIFTSAGFRDLFMWIKLISSKKWAASVPTDLPIYIFSGDQDPVGAFGLGVKKVAKWLRESGHKTKLKLYEGGRHEMLNETNRQEVWQDVANWLSDLTSNMLE